MVFIKQKQLAVWCRLNFGLIFWLPNTLNPCILMYVRESDCLSPVSLTWIYSRLVCQLQLSQVFVTRVNLVACTYKHKESPPVHSVYNLSILKTVIMLAAPKDKFSDLLAAMTVIVEGSCVQNLLELCLSTVCLEQTGDVFAAHYQ